MNKIEEITALAVVGMTLALSAQPDSNDTVVTGSDCGPKYYVEGCQCNVHRSNTKTFNKKSLRCHASEHAV